ncbi:MAG: hypothetical protein EOP56_17405 [Sphingobacteriales bacterium]|nr:MAG: hypothetical protein EOP56_17405 [Sphingobacteriales bacterium]
MRLAYPKQNILDWITQQWNIVFGKKIRPKTAPWLMGPFGALNGISDKFVQQLAASEGLVITRNDKVRGLIPSLKDLNFTDEALSRLSPHIIDFYERTGSYQLGFSVKWNPLFRSFGTLVNLLFSNRINQLNIPTGNVSGQQITSEIITLSDPDSGIVIYTVWYRTFRSTGRVLYSGIYTTCTLPSGKVCVKAIFPLPKGNATVIMAPHIGPNGELRLDGSGKKFGDPGFYFLLNDSKDNVSSQYIRSFRDQLTISGCGENIVAEQILTLWGMRVLRFNYSISCGVSN